MDEPGTNTASTPPAQAPRALDGIRVLDFSWVRAGPWATRWLGALGAEVIKIEWPENERGRGGTLSTPQDVPVNLNTNGNFNDTNANKLSVSLNVRSELGMDIIKRLLAISDIVIENFSSRVLTKWGLSYDAMREIKHRLRFDVRLRPHRTQPQLHNVRPSGTGRQWLDSAIGFA
jgi:crotonobetainyl-CoA:carnitine CoA-transferase CaiB-like acyl-CoA transferase